MPFSVRYLLVFFATVVTMRMDSFGGGEAYLAEPLKMFQLHSLPALQKIDKLSLFIYGFLLRLLLLV